MKRIELREMIKGLLDDAVGSDSEQYWPKAALNIYIQEAFDEIAKRTLCLKDSITPAYCAIDMVADQIHYPFPGRVLEIIEVRRSWDGKKLGHTTYELASKNPLWKQVSCEPVSFMTDFSFKTLSIVGRLPAVTDQTLELTVYRLPAIMTDDKNVCDVPEEHHTKTVNWVLARCFAKQDAETYNPKKAEAHLVGFEGTPSQLGKGGDIRQIIMQTSTNRPHPSKSRFI